MSRARKPANYELMFQEASCQKCLDCRVVQLGADPRETLTAAECRRLAAWLLLAAKWIEAKSKKEGGR